MKKTLIFIVMLIFLGLAFYWVEAGTKKEIKANSPTALNCKKLIPVETALLHCVSIDSRLHLIGTIISEAMVMYYARYKAS